LEGGDLMPTATLTSKGQMVIPKAIRDRLGLHPGDVLDFVVQDNGDVLIRPATEDVRQLKGLLHRADRLPVSVGAMNQAIRSRRGKHR
jgi:antitoxin PrlF